MSEYLNNDYLVDAMDYLRWRTWWIIVLFFLFLAFQECIVKYV